jgi:hypothetical protein
VPARHLLIAGTGRAGTTALMQLLEGCGLDIGSDRMRYFRGTRSGLEQRLDPERSPYVVKRPYLSDDLSWLFDHGMDPSQIDAVIVPIRSLDAAAASRIKVFAEYGLGAPGGLWRGHRPSRQRVVLAESVYRLIETTTTHDIPLVFLGFPNFITDAEYAWDRIGPVLPTVTRSVFLAQHAELIQPELVGSPSYPGPTKLALLDGRWALQVVRRRARRLLTHREATDPSPGTA